MTTNYVIYHRNNSMLGLSNHIDSDGDLDPNYALLRNTALTGHFKDGKFISKNEKRFNWLKECAHKGCPICNGIFKDVSNKNYTIKPFYLNKVVKVVNTKTGNVVEKPITKWDNLAKKAVTPVKVSDEDKHPLFDYILEVFNGKK